MIGSVSPVARGWRACWRGALAMLGLLAVGLVVVGLWASPARADGGAGSLLAWGDNAFGELGDGSTTSSPVPVAVSGGAIPAGTKITQIAAGAVNSVGLSSTGQVYAWGFNTNGELGNGSMSSSPVPAPVSVPIGTTFTQIAAGGYHSLALDSTGKLYAWGLNEYGELGNGTAAQSLVPVAVSPGTTITQIAASQDDSLALSSTGQLYAWGDNSSGELGNNDTTSSPVAVAVSLPATTTVDALARGSEAQHALAIIGDLSLTTSSLPAGTVGSAYSATLSGSGGATPYRWARTGLPSGLSLDPVSGHLSGTPTISGSYAVTVGLADTEGLTTDRSIPLTIAPAAGSPGSGSPAPPGSGSPGSPAQQCPAGPTGTRPICHKPPMLTGVTQSRRIWREPGSHSHKAPVGTTFSLTLNQAATVSLAFTRQVPGRKVKHGCVAPSRENRHKPVCKRTAVRGQLSVAAHAGKNKLPFLGRITKSNKLKPGRYTVKLTASNPARQHSGQQSLTFTIVK